MTNLIVKNLQFFLVKMPCRIGLMQNLYGRSSAGNTSTVEATSHVCHSRFLAGKDAIVALLHCSQHFLFLKICPRTKTWLPCLPWQPCITGISSLPLLCSILQKTGKTEFFPCMTILPFTDYDWMIVHHSNLKKVFL